MTRRNRAGFTLVELLVVMAIMAIMATFVIAFYPNAASADREARAGQVVQSTFNIAKQRAVRDQAPRGVRLWLVPPPGFNIGGVNLLNVVTDMQYTEQPDDFTGGTIQNGLPALAAPGYNLANCLKINGPDVTNGYPVNWPSPAAGDPNEKYWSVQPGDYVELCGTGLMFRITQIGVPNTSNVPDPQYLVVTPAVPYLVNTPTANYRILRAPRPVGDETIKLPEGTLIDLGVNATYANPLPAPNALTEGSGFYDILFAPNGSVISRGVATDKLHLFVRAPNEQAPANIFRGTPTVVSIFVRTGFVGAYNADPNGATPYTFVK